MRLYAGHYISNRYPTVSIPLPLGMSRRHAGNDACSLCSEAPIRRSVTPQLPTVAVDVRMLEWAIRFPRSAFIM